MRKVAKILSDEIAGIKLFTYFLFFKFFVIKLFVIYSPILTIFAKRVQKIFSSPRS